MRSYELCQKSSYNLHDGSDALRQSLWWDVHHTINKDMLSLGAQYTWAPAMLINELFSQSSNWANFNSSDWTLHGSLIFILTELLFSCKGHGIFDLFKLNNHNTFATQFHLRMTLQSGGGLISVRLSLCKERVLVFLKGFQVNLPDLWAVECFDELAEEIPLLDEVVEFCELEEPLLLTDDMLLLLLGLPDTVPDFDEFC